VSSPDNVIVLSTDEIADREREEAVREFYGRICMRLDLAPLEGGKKTEVTYQLTVDVKIPMLGMIKRKAEKVIIDRALDGLKKRVESGPAA